MGGEREEMTNNNISCANCTTANAGLLVLHHVSKLMHDSRIGDAMVAGVTATYMSRATASPVATRLNARVVGICTPVDGISTWSGCWSHCHAMLSLLTITFWFPPKKPTGGYQGKKGSTANHAVMLQLKLCRCPTLTPSACMASLATYSLTLDRSTARPSARLLYGVRPAPLSCSSQRSPLLLTTSPRLIARPSPNWPAH